MTQKSPVLGILGGGQLGRMSALAAAKLGIRTHIYSPEDNCPASQVTDKTITAPYDDEKALETFAKSVDFIGYEFENIPVETITYLETTKPVRPGKYLLSICQDRVKEKTFLNKNGIQTALWAPCNDKDDITSSLTLWKTSDCIIKTTRFGYDGKGQLKHSITNDTLLSFTKFGSQTLIIEQIVDFAYEASIIVARDTYGKIVFYPLTLNTHKDQILSTSRPGGAEKSIEDQARVIAAKVAESLELVGVLAIELFVTHDGTVLVNEMAPRTHNSGHWTMDGCDISQFDNHVRAVCGLPVLPPRQHSDVTMINLIGDDVEDLSHYYAMEGACIHLYGKGEARPGRKMGHVNIVKPL